MWIIFGIASVAMAVSTTIWNQHIKESAARLNYWRCLYTTLVMSLGLPFVVFPTDPSFYISAVFAGITSAVTSISIFHTAKHHSAHTAALFMPVAMVLTFIGWTLLDPVYRTALFETPWKAVLILAAMVMTNAAVVVMRGIKINNLNYGWLIALNAMVIAVSFIFIKKTTAGVLNDVFVLSWILFFIQTVSSYAFAKIQGEEIGKPMHGNAFWFLCLCGLIRGFTLWFAVILAPNPSYATAIMLMVPFFVAIYNKIRNDDITDSFKPGLVISLCSLLIVILSF